MSSILRELVVVVVGANLAACDVVWGLSGEPSACELRSFDGAAELEMISGGDQYTVDGNAKLAVISISGQLFERTLGGGEPVPLALGPYPPMSIALAPEADLLFHSAGIEPPLLQVAIRNAEGIFVPADRPGPKGVIAGVPSSEAFGPRRVMVRTKLFGDLQEYEDDGEAWVSVGPRIPGLGSTAPNLTENGLTMVFVDLDPATESSAVFAASRDSTSEPFGESTLLRPVSLNASAQLSGKKTCNTLFTSETDALRRYDR